jgi:hypothetical protein
MISGLFGGLGIAWMIFIIHTLNKDGSIAGMLSVNGFTGDVWYHK